MADFATHQDLASYWRPLSLTEQERATNLLGYAAMFIRQEVPGIDELIAANPSLIVAARYVSVDMVSTAMAISPNHHGKVSYSEAKGPFNQSATFDAGRFGTLELSAQHRKLLGLNDNTPVWQFPEASCLRW